MNLVDTLVWMQPILNYYLSPTTICECCSCLVPKRDRQGFQLSCSNHENYVGWSYIFFFSLIIINASTYICNNVVFIHILHVLLHLYTYQWYLNRFIKNKHLLSDFKMWSQYRNNSRSGSTKTSLGRYKKHLWTYRLTRTVCYCVCMSCLLTVSI